MKTKWWLTLLQIPFLIGTALGYTCSSCNEKFSDDHALVADYRNTKRIELGVEGQALESVQRGAIATSVPEEYVCSRCRCLNTRDRIIPGIWPAIGSPNPTVRVRCLNIKDENHDFCSECLSQTVARDHDREDADEEPGIMIWIPCKNKTCMSKIKCKVVDRRIEWTGDPFFEAFYEANRYLEIMPGHETFPPQQSLKPKASDYVCKSCRCCFGASYTIPDGDLRTKQYVSCVNMKTQGKYCQNHHKPSQRARTKTDAQNMFTKEVCGTMTETVNRIRQHLKECYKNITQCVQNERAIRKILSDTKRREAIRNEVRTTHDFERIFNSRITNEHGQTIFPPRRSEDPRVVQKRISRETLTAELPEKPYNSDTTDSVTSDWPSEASGKTSQGSCSPGEYYRGREFIRRKSMWSNEAKRMYHLRRFEEHLKHINEIRRAEDTHQKSNNSRKVTNV